MASNYKIDDWGTFAISKSDSSATTKRKHRTRKKKNRMDENVSRLASRYATEKAKYENNKVDGSCNPIFNTYSQKLPKTKGDINSTNGLINLLQESEIDILYTLLGDRAYVDLLSRYEYKPEFMAALLNVFGKASEAPQPSNVSRLLHEIMCHHYFVTRVLLYILHCRRTVNHEIDLNALVNFLKLLNKFQFYEPSNSVDTVVAILPLLEGTIDIFSSKGVNVQELNNLLSDIKEQKNNVAEIFIKNKSQERVQHQEPPDNFRSLSIIPTVNDVKEVNVFIRPNIVEGKYADTEHYLDVQYRLLREDFVRPLRLGIQQYLYLLAVGQLTVKNLKKIQDMKFYQDFKVLYPIFDKQGIFYLASFDTSLFSHVNWECTKRFMTGSLICFSDDNFDSIVFASIAQRDVKLLKQGLLIIKLEESSSDSLKCGLSNSCIMVETEAYFEAYRHNLAALQEMNDNNMPFQDYIVHVNKEIKHPSYLNLSSRYCMFFGDVSVLKSDQWPSKERLGFDHSQYEAFKAAITKEFSIIQGPPGTGKTYIALKITETLLRNKYCVPNPSPILVVCYTNHALDQFLEGILSYTDKVGRVGGRCENDKLAPYMLKNLRIEERKFSNVSTNVKKMVGRTYAELCRYLEAMDKYNDKFDACISNILQDELLLSVMSRDHYHSLRSVINNIRSYDGNLIKDWLALRSNEISQMSLLQDKTFYNSQNEQNASDNQQKNSVKITTTDSEVDSKDSEVHFIEGIRMIDDDNISLQLKSFQLEQKEEITETKEGWVTQSRKNKNELIRHKLKSTKAMLYSEVCKVTDIWQLNLEKRWSLYMYWVECFMKRLNQDIVEAKDHILHLQEQLREIRSVEDANILERCDIIGITTTGAAKYKNIIKKLKPQIVIFEEAAEVLEAHVVTSLTEDTKHVILIGDHQQLRPNPTVYELAKNYNFDVSLFERMVKNGLECHKLTFQHRMRPSIASLLTPHIYPDLKNHESVFSYPHIKGIDKNMFFINHNVYETENTEMKSHANKHEAKFILALARYLIMQGYKSTQITILTTYSGQLFLLKQLRKDKLLTDVRITVVDSYQGEENDIILISFVRSNEHGGVGFLKISNRVCVSLSRAKQGLYCIGNFDLLGKSCNLWKEIQAKLVAAENIGSALKLNCQLHPEMSVKVSTAEDFENVPEGGCSRICGRKLSCGHFCAKKCHPTDLEHIEYQCMEPCSKVLCENQHACPRLCHQECKPCKARVTKIVPYCGHTNEMPCHVNPYQYSCKEKCSKALLCGHSCLSICGQCRSNFSCLDCKTKIITKAMCGHDVKIVCHKKFDPFAIQAACTKHCITILNCTHKCKGRCNTCIQVSSEGIVLQHPKCKRKCVRLMPCGHTCRNPCADTCSLICDEIVDEKYDCGHIGRVKCSELFSTECNSPCTAVLPCGHTCSGNCAKCNYGMNHIPCKKIVTHMLVCGHTVNLPCSCTQYPLCEKLCSKNLPCGHKCRQKCRDLCAVQCNAVVTLPKSCGHVEPGLCHERNQKCKACISSFFKLKYVSASDSYKPKQEMGRVISDSYKPKQEKRCVISDSNKLKQEKGCMISDSNKPKQEKGCVISDSNKPKQEKECVISDSNKPKQEKGCVISDVNKPKQEKVCVISDINKPKQEKGCVIA